MNREEILAKVAEICKDVFEDEALVITESITKNDVEKWDSLAHLALMNEIEDQFDITLMLEEMTSIKSISDVVDVVLKHSK